MTNHDTRIGRRTLLRGAGCAMTLPWLESIPVWGSEASASPPKRFAALFMANGVNPNHWWAKGNGADMELGRSLKPLESIKTKTNVISGLFNKNSTGVGIHPGQTGNILSGASLPDSLISIVTANWTSSPRHRIRSVGSCIAMTAASYAPIHFGSRTKRPTAIISTCST